MKADILPALLVALGYYMLAWLGLEFSNVAGTVTVIWPASGLALVALIKFGKYTWVGILIGSFASGFLVRDSIWLSLFIASGNTLEPVVSVWLLKRTRFNPSIDSISDFFILLLFAVCIGPIVSALVGTSGLFAAGFLHSSNCFYTFLRWWMADAIGVILVAPTLLIWSNANRTSSYSMIHAIEATALVIFSFLIGQIIFFEWFHDELGKYVYGFWVLPGIAWTALRFGRLFTALILLLMSIQSLWGSFFEVGVFAEDMQKTGLINLWLFNAVLYITGMTIALVFHERKKSEDKLQLAARVFTDAHEGIMLTDKQAIIIDVNPVFSNITGYSRKEVIGKNPRMLNSDKQSSEFYTDMWKSLDEQGHWQGELWNRKKTGELFAVLLTISAIRDTNGYIHNYIGLFSDITQSMLEQQKMELLAHYDVLTKLPNRTLFDDRFQQAIAHSRRDNTLLAICFLDLDGFKPINDRYGHEAGDQILFDVAERIKLSVRAEDTVSRLGGDEFALLLGELESLDHCKQVMKRLHHNITQPYLVDGHMVTIGVSSGITFYPMDDVSPSILLRHADQAMYQAKLAGKNRYHLFDVENN